MYVIHSTLRVSEPTRESESVTVNDLLPIGPTRRFYLCLLRGRAPQSPHMSSSPRSVAFRDKSIVPVGVVGLLLRRRSSAVTLAPMALSSAVSADLPIPRICWRRPCRSTS